MAERKKSLTKKQHYLPKAYLQFFSCQEGAVKKIYAFFCKENFVRYVKIDDICQRTYLYEQRIDKSPLFPEGIFAPNQIENSFIDAEGEYAKLVDTLARGVYENDTIVLDDNEKRRVASFMSSIIARNPLLVHITNTVSSIEYPEKLAKAKKRYPNVPISIFKPLFAKVNLEMFLETATQAILDTMEDSQMIVLQSETSTFITSDMPVVNICGETNGVEYDLLGFPITPRLFLAFVDTTADVPSIVCVDDDMVNAINSRQLNKGTRYILSNDKRVAEFVETAKTVVAEDERYARGIGKSLLDEEDAHLYEEIMSTYKY